MSITNFINSEVSTIVQGVNGIRLCQESWMTERAMRQTERCKPAAQSGGTYNKESSVSLIKTERCVDET